MSRLGVLEIKLWIRMLQLKKSTFYDSYLKMVFGKIILEFLIFLKKYFKTIFQRTVLESSFFFYKKNDILKRFMKKPS